MNEKCKGKLPYFTKAEAEAACESLKRDAKKTGEGGRSFRRLEVYVCGNHFHIGRGNRYVPPKPAPATTIPSRGQQLKRLARIEDRLHKELKHRAYVQGQMIDADYRAEKAKRQRDYEAACDAVGIKP